MRETAKAFEHFRLPYRRPTGFFHCLPRITLDASPLCSDQRQHGNSVRGYCECLLPFASPTFRTTDQPGGTRRIFQGLGLDPNAWGDFSAQVAEAPSSLSQYKQRMMKEFYSQRWFRVRGAEEYTATRRASRPGDNLADLAFSFALNRLLKKFEAQVLTKFPHLTITWNGLLAPHPDPIWADDVALAIHSDTPAELLPMLEVIGGDLLDFLALAANMSTGKTEALVDLRGQGSLRFRRVLAMEEWKMHC